MVVLTAPVWIPGLALLIAVVVVARVVKVTALYALVWTFWLGVSPRRVLFVYSESPNWTAYVESRILPRLPENTVVLNLYLLGTPLALGSYWGLLGLAFMLPFLLWRLLDEERLLARELPGYTDYQARVRYRLMPFVW